MLLSQKSRGNARARKIMQYGGTGAIRKEPPKADSRKDPRKGNRQPGMFNIQ